MKAIMILVIETILILVTPPYSSSCNFCEFIHYYNLWFLKLSKLTIFSTFTNETSPFLLKAYDLNKICDFLLMNLIKMTYLTIYEIEHSVKLNKKLTILVKMVNEF